MNGCQLHRVQRGIKSTNCSSPPRRKPFVSVVSVRERPGYICKSRCLLWTEAVRGQSSHAAVAVVGSLSGPRSFPVHHVCFIGFPTTISLWTTCLCKSLQQTQQVFISRPATRFSKTVHRQLRDTWSKRVTPQLQDSPK